ncbi:MAG: MFS transporter [Acidimicrobiales bacterium]
MTWRANPRTARLEDKGSNRPPGWRSGVNAPAYLAAGLSRASAAMLLFIVPFRVTALGWSPAVVGLEVGAIFAGPMLLAVPMGQMVDRLGVRRVVLLSSVLGATAVAFCSVATAEGPLAFLLVLAGLSQSALWIAAQTAVGAAGGGSFGWLSAAAQGGNVAGPVVAGIVAARQGDSAVFLASAGALGALALVTTLVKSAQPVAHEASQKRGHVVKQAAELLRRPGIRLLLGVTMLRVGLVVIRGSFYPLLLHHQGLSKASTGGLVALVALIGVVVAPIGGRLHTDLTKRVALLGGMAGASVAFVLAPAVTGMTPQLGVAAILGVGLGISQPTLLHQFNQLVPGEARGFAVGLRTSVARVSQLSVPVGLGLVVGVLSLPVALVAFGLVAMLTTGALAVSPAGRGGIGPAGPTGGP